MLLGAMEISQRTAQELMPQEESDSWDIDTFVQQLHGEGVPEAVEFEFVGIHRHFERR